ncbi:hypothetical protein OESDEN_21691 [Oesophagostomum dentatum]|uniref:Uncharacterized protein n=1 Tax=Oesophagostomum dentatum TaxID=61180 RepID=A0A0B1S493_OESDE|nr:hypothetical protein OESDEN_21691 [Oesophagostomum dentatum]
MTWHNNIEWLPAEIDAIVTEAISLSGYIKVALVILCILLVLAIIRLSAFGLRCIIFKARDWIRANENKPPPQVEFFDRQRLLDPKTSSYAFV